MSKEKTILSKECRFVVHVPSKSPQGNDIHLIKELIHYSDGTVKPNVAILENYIRPFYITKKSKRIHSSKKEWENIDNLERFECTQSELKYKIATVLGKPWTRESIKEISRSPYLYGTDISSSALIKKEYKDKYPNVVTGYTTAVYDIETDMLRGTEEIIVATLIFQNKIYTVATKEYMRNMPNGPQLIYDKFNNLLKEYIEKRDLKLEFDIVATPAQAVIAIFKKANEWKPDWIAIWNMDFDIPRSIKALENEGYDPATVLSDPSIPKEYRKCWYKEGRRKKITSSGKVIPINPSSQWHTLILTSSFYIIDAMCSYKLLRSPPGPEEASYSLEYILNLEMGYGKLKFKEADGYTGAQWHEVMQSRYKVEYIIYNIFDCLGIIELNDKTKDLSNTLPEFAGVTEFEKYNSNPKKIHDELHFFCLSKGLVISSSGSTQKNEEESDDSVEIDYSEEPVESEYSTLDLRGWIVTLPAHLTENLGLPIIKEDPELRSNIRGYVFDSDCVSAYPSAIIGCNVSKETTKKEISSVYGKDEYTVRMNNINLVYGPVNAIEYCTDMFGFPTLNELSKLV